ncbi:MAG: CDP-alcohol phosphatidyltransferase family protein [Polyangiales bacterium]
MSTPKLPAFESLLKSRDVEDPVNLWVHRPLAYGIVALIYRSAVTPNQITALATLVGLGAGVCFFLGTPALMIWGGAMLWASAILDGADGILARAQRSGSDFGRAIDGTADAVVGFGSVLPAFYHLWVTHHDLTVLLLSPVAVLSAIAHIYLYDFYKESYMQQTDPSWSGKPERLTDVDARIARAKAEGATVAAMSSRTYGDLMRLQTLVVPRLDPWGSREHLRFSVTPDSVESYRRHNRGPIKLWSMISLAPHCYVMAVCAMFDKLEVYFWLRLVACNVIFVIVMLWQRAASRRSREDLAALGLSPVPAS